MEAVVNQRGFTILEMAVAMTVLIIGGGTVWYSLQSASKIDKLNRIHQAALRMAQSDLESLRGVQRANIRDSAYRSPGPGGEELLVVREVFDSVRIVSTLQEITLDDKFTPLELKKPLEVRVRVWQLPPDGQEGTSWTAYEGHSPESLTASESSPPGRLLTSLTFKLPDYRWY